MTTRTIPWRRRAPALILAALAHALIIVVFLRGLTLTAGAVHEAPLLVNIVSPPPSPAPLPPPLPNPRLAPSPPIPSIIPPLVSLPTVLSTPAPAAPAPKVIVRPPARLAASGVSGETPPKFIAPPLDYNERYPMAARMSFSQGLVLTRVCIYSTGEVASVALLTSSGDKELDDAALGIARQGRWRPATANGKPVARCSPFSVDFSLTRPMGFNSLP